MKKLLLIPALLAGSLAFADGHKYEISPLIGYNISEGNLGMKHDGYFIGGLEGQYNLENSNWSPELSAFYTKGADYKTIGDANILRVAGNGVYTFDMQTIKPFVKAGLGYEFIKRRNYSNQNGFFVDAGAGAKVSLTDMISLKLEAIYMAKGNSNNAGNADSNLMTLAGLTFAFGGETPKAAPVAPAPAPVVVVVDVEVDDDHDGVLNSVDQCIYTPVNTPVDAKGCALDDDKDGVANNLDQCPQTEVGKEVDTKGCQIQLDDDNDGVLNAADLCPTTPAGDKVNSDGCTKVVNLHVNFARDSYKIVADSMTDINAYANFLKKHTNYSAYIVGYTDSRGSAAYNKKLSKNRAQAVVNELISEGVSKQQLSSLGMGEANPVADNATREGRALNRRIEAELIKH